MQGPGFDRRQFLRRTAGLGATVGVMGLVGPACTPTIDPLPAVPRLAAFSERQSRVLHALVEVALPGTDAVPGGLALGVPASIDAALMRESELLRSQLGDALLLLEWAPQFSSRWRPFSYLDPADRLAVFEGFSRSWWTVKRTVYQAFKGLLAYHYTDMPEVWTLIGYDGPWVPSGGLGAVASGADPADAAAAQTAPPDAAPVTETTP